MAIHDEIDTPLAKACRTIGSQSALARLIGKDQSTVYERLRAQKPLWAEDVLAVEAATGVSRHRLRLDLYPREGCCALACPEHGADASLQPPAAQGVGVAGGSPALEGVRS